MAMATYFSFRLKIFVSIVYLIIDFILLLESAAGSSHEQAESTAPEVTTDIDADPDLGN